MHEIMVFAHKEKEKDRISNLWAGTSLERWERACEQAPELKELFDGRRPTKAPEFKKKLVKAMQKLPRECQATRSLKNFSDSLISWSTNQNYRRFAGDELRFRTVQNRNFVQFPENKPVAWIFCESHLKPWRPQPAWMTQHKALCSTSSPYKIISETEVIPHYREVVIPWSAWNMILRLNDYDNEWPFNPERAMVKNYPNEITGTLAKDFLEDLKFSFFTHEANLVRNWLVSLISNSQITLHWQKRASREVCLDFNLFHSPKQPKTPTKKASELLKEALSNDLGSTI